MLLAYYIAAVNIENTYHEKMRESGAETEYEPFDGIVLTDTFQSSEPNDRQDTSMFPRNNDRMERQLGLDIRVILGNRRGPLVRRRTTTRIGIIPIPLWTSALLIHMPTARQQRQRNNSTTNTYVQFDGHPIGSSTPRRRSRSICHQ